MALVVREAAPSPRLKFLCSYGGRILPRPSDGQLKYVGGETRVVAIPRFVTFPELKEKIASVHKAEAVIKYQMASEDLDAVVSVTCDEDLHHMIEEYDRLEASSASTHPRLRVFLFPVPTPSATPTFDGATGASTPGGRHQLPHHHPALHLAGTALEQRYVDAINGGAVGRTPPPAGLPSPRGLTIVPPARSAFADSSAETSPTSAAVEAFGRGDSPGRLACGGGRCAWRHSGGEGGGAAGRAMQDMHRVRSSPNLQHGGHWPQQQQGLRIQVLHGGAAVEYDAGSSPMGNALRWHPPPVHYSGTTVYYSPVHTPRQQGGAGGGCGQYADELCRPEERG